MTKEKYDTQWKFKKSHDYYRDLAMRESSGRARIEKGQHKGLYQMGDAALIDTGYISRYTKEWTGKHNINSKQDFLNNPIVQNIAIREYHKIVWGYLKNYHQYEGQEINEIKLTKAGMISVAHLVGQGKLKQFIISNGENDSEDDNKTKCSEYLSEFSEYEIDYSIEGLLKTLEDNQKESLEENLQEEKSSEESLKEQLGKLSIKDLDPICAEKFKEAELLKERLGKKFEDLVDRHKELMQEKLNKEIDNICEQKAVELLHFRQSLQGLLNSLKDALLTEGQAEADAFLEQQVKAHNEKVAAKNLSNQLAAASDNPILPPTPPVSFNNTEFVAKKNAKMESKLASIKASVNEQLNSEVQKCNQEIDRLTLEKLKNQEKESNSYVAEINNYLQQCFKDLAIRTWDDPQTNLHDIEDQALEHADHFAQLMGLEDSSNLDITK